MTGKLRTRAQVMRSFLADAGVLTRNDFQFRVPSNERLWVVDTGEFTTSQQSLKEGDVIKALAKALNSAEP